MTTSTESAKDISPSSLGRWSTLPSVAEDGGAPLLRLDAGSNFPDGFSSIPASATERIGTLDLRNQRIPEGLAAWIAKLPNLRTLVLAGSTLTDEDVQALSASSSLRALDLSSTPITSEALQRIGDLRGLRSLVLGRTSVDDDAAPFLAKLTALEALRLGQTHMTCEAAPTLASITSLREFEPPSQFGDDAFHHFRNHRFTSLWLSNTAVTDHAFDPFPENSALGFIALSDLFGEVGCRTLVRFANLSALWLESASLTREAFEALGALPKLSTLFIAAPLQDEAMRALAHLPALRRLALLARRPTRFHLELLAEAKSLEELHMDASELSDADVWLFGEIKSLKRLHVEASNFSAAAFVELRERIPKVNLTHPTRVYTLPAPTIVGNVMRRQHTADGSAPWTRCKWSGASFSFAPDDELSFRVQLTDQFPELESLAKSAGSHFVELKFDTCSLDETTVRFLPRFTSLASLELRASTVDKSLFSVISEHLKKLRKIVLDFTELDDADAPLLARCESLVEIHVRRTMITDEGLRVLAAMPNARRILVEGCNVSVAEMERLQSHHPHLQFA